MEGDGSGRRGGLTPRPLAQRDSPSGGIPPQKLSSISQTKSRKNKEESKNMRAARTDKFVFQVKLNPSLSVEMRPFVLNSHSIGSNAYRRQLPQKEQDIRTKRPARSGRDKSDSSPGSPCCLRVSQLSERASFRCVRRTNLQRSGVRSGKHSRWSILSG